MTFLLTASRVQGTSYLSKEKAFIVSYYGYQLSKQQIICMEVEM